MKDFSRWVMESFSGAESLIAYLFVSCLAMFSGAVGHFYRRSVIPHDRRRAFSWQDFSFEQATSLLVAVIVFWLTLNGNLPPLITAISIALVAFWGTGALLFILRQFRKALNDAKQTEITRPEKQDGQRNYIP